MKLFHRDFGGEGDDLVILHGLMGSSRNWMRAGRDLAESFRVLAPDLRNHGESPHDPAHDFTSLGGDVVEWLDENGLDEVFLLGHSLGGKTAMRVACECPGRVRALVVVDISPARKEPSYRREIEALAALPLDRIESRTDADRSLAKEIPDAFMRQFLFTNLVRESGGGWAWQPNLDALIRNLDETGNAPIGPDARYKGPSLFVLGENSDFVREEDHEIIRRHFPKAKIETISGAGHNPHVERRGAFVALVRSFLRES